MNYNQMPYNLNPNQMPFNQQSPQQNMNPNMNPNYNTSPFNPSQQSQQMPFETPKQSNDEYMETILAFNKGKLATLYLTFDDSLEFRDKIFKGIIMGIGKDHVSISDPKTGKYIMIPLVYVDWIEFDEEIAYDMNYKPRMY